MLKNAKFEMLKIFNVNYECREVVPKFNNIREEGNGIGVDSRW